MLRLRDIMTRDVLTLGPELSIREAMTLLSTRHVSGAPVVAGGRVLGVISATDLLDFAASLPGVRVEPLATLEDGPCEDGPREDGPRGGRRSEPSEEEGAVADFDPTGAYFTEMWSDEGADAVERFRSTGGPEWNALEQHTVAEAMTASVCSLSPDAPVPYAADYMRRAGIHRVLVMEGGRLAGITSATDIARAVADHRLTTRTYVFDRGRDFDERGWTFGDADPDA